MIRKVYLCIFLKVKTGLASLTTALMEELLIFRTVYVRL